MKFKAYKKLDKKQQNIKRGKRLAFFIKKLCNFLQSFVLVCSLLLNAVNKAVKLGHGRRAVADERADAVFQKRCAVLFGEVADFLGCPALGYHAAKVAVDFDNFVNCGTSLVAGVAAAGTADRLINMSD